MSSIVQTSADPANQYFMNRFPGYRLEAFQVDKEDGHTTFHLSPTLDGVKCPTCGQYCNRFHDDRTKVIKDWDIVAGASVDVVIPSRRVRCRCGCKKTEADPQWVLPGHRITTNLAGFIQRLLRGRINVQEVSRITGVEWDAVKLLDKAQLEPLFKNVDLTKAVRLAIDEISIEKGHSYATVVMDLDRDQILHVCMGKRQVDLQPFFDELKKLKRAHKIISVSVDMNAGFPALVKKNLRKARLAYDLFHVMQLFNRNVLVEAKRESIARARRIITDVPKSQRTSAMYDNRDFHIDLVKKAEWLVIRNPEGMKPHAKKRLDLLREYNALFRDIYPLAEQIRAIWRAPSKTKALELLNVAISLCEELAEQHKFKPLLKFAEMLVKRKNGILNACVVGLGTNKLEGANNTAKVIKRVAYGYRDFEYYALKLKSAFPGKDFKKEKEDKEKVKSWNLWWDGKKTPLGLPAGFTN